MSFQSVIDDHSALLSFVIDSHHPQEVKDQLEAWLRPIRPGMITYWENSEKLPGLSIWLPSPPRLMKAQEKTGHTLLVRPRNRDLLSLDADQSAEAEVDAVIDAGDEGETFRQIIGMWLTNYLHERGRTQEKIAQKFQRLLDRELKIGIKEIENDPELLKGFLEIFALYLEISPELLGRAEWDMLEKDLETLARQLDKKKNWRLLQAGSAHEVKKTTGLYFIGRLKGVSIFAENTVRAETALGHVSTALILHGLRHQLRHWEAGDTSAGPGQLVAEAFQGLPVPTLLLGENGEVLQHNTAFVKLNLPPSKVQKLADLDQITAKGQTWSVRRLGLRGAQGERSAFTFLPVSSSFSGTGIGAGGQELGIITSSIAHELNNPLAGLLTALELMAMDDHWDEESRTALSEMRQGATRCKQLVDTFLGFSRVRTDTAMTSDKDLLKRSGEQALHLLRFRMVESGLRLQLNWQQSHPYAYPLHGPSITMAIYLVLGEYMTALHHLKLLESKAAHGLVIEGQVSEDADNFVLQFSEELPRPLGFSSKLLQYLLQQERVVLEERGSSFHFSHQNVLI